MRSSKVLAVVLVIILAGCKKDDVPVPAVLTTSDVHDITQTTAISGGNITSGTSVTVRGVCWSTLENPEATGSHTTDGTGTGTFESSITGLSPNTIYHVRAYATNSTGTSYGFDRAFTNTPEEPYVYQEITIGTQIWMTENLKVTTYNDGTPIPWVTNNAAWEGLVGYDQQTTAAYCWYNNDAPTYKNTYGAFYNWYAVNTGKLCPTGWHVPTDAEWTKLITYLGGESVAGGKLKETGINHWLSPNEGATNESSFTALPGGYRDAVDGEFGWIGELGSFWSSSKRNTDHVWVFALFNVNVSVDRSGFGTKRGGQSVRCIKD